MKKAYLFTNSPEVNPEVFEHINDGDFLCGIDGGTRFLLKAGINPEIAIGDFDSIDKSRINQDKTKIYTFQSDKDETDTELALDYISRNKEKLGITECVIVTHVSGRFDQIIGLISNLQYAESLNLPTRIFTGTEWLMIVNSGIEIAVPVNSTVSLIPLDEEVKIKKVSGLKYTLTNESLYRYRTRGISNICEENSFTVEIEKGKLLAVYEEC